MLGKKCPHLLTLHPLKKSRILFNTAIGISNSKVLSDLYKKNDYKAYDACAMQQPAALAHILIDNRMSYKRCDMNSGTYIALSGAKHQEMRLELLANNMANASTAGFKAERITASSFAFELERANEDIYRPSGFGELGLQNVAFNGVYSKAGHAYTEFMQGEQKFTGNNLDLSLNGRGFFELETPNGLRYTRDGSFRLNSKGDLISADGYALQGKGLTGLEQGAITVDKDGGVSIDGSNSGSINIVEFDDPSILKKDGMNLFVAPAGTGFEKKAKDTTVMQGYLEMPGMSVVKEMVNLIELNRLYETYQKTILSIDESTRTVIEEVGS